MFDIRFFYNRQSKRLGLSPDCAMPKTLNTAAIAALLGVGIIGLVCRGVTGRDSDVPMPALQAE